MSCKCKKECSCKKPCQCNKCNPWQWVKFPNCKDAEKECNKCNPCKCSCENKCEWVKFPNCKDTDRKDIYEFLGKFVYELLEDMDLPCGHPGIKEIIKIVEDGGHLPCGHPGLEEIILRAILENDKSLCKVAQKICGKR
ncbi:hypothetical protein GCM10008904_11870 [Paraclostridium ghonii]|uniref:Uncharacterized protein n=1 Tax=Paraclostridium ghonii TaxID=29358 RepID=A0ABU0N1D1_9FIRM|nr:hypothetical protein [Paeniclostridium ghonii]MDQ0556968.1 hypothetical protein [Paeniclostridium ghonii]